MEIKLIRNNRKGQYNETLFERSLSSWVKHRTTMFVDMAFQCD